MCVSSGICNPFLISLNHPFQKIIQDNSSNLGYIKVTCVFDQTIWRDTYCQYHSVDWCVQDPILQSDKTFLRRHIHDDTVISVHATSDIHKIGSQVVFIGKRGTFK